MPLIEQNKNFVQLSGGEYAPFTDLGYFNG